MATLRGEPVDRPAVSFYEVGGFLVNPDDPDPFNIYNAPGWQPLLQLAEERTDIIRMMSPVRPQSHLAWADHGGRFAIRTEDDGVVRTTLTTVQVGGRTLTSTTRRERELNTVWTTEHLLKGVDDAEAYLELPDEALDAPVDLAPLWEEERRLGDRGIVMVDTEDPLCAVATLFSMEDYTVLALTAPALFHRLLEQHARILHRRTERVAAKFPGRLWRIYGPEYASEPYLPPRLFEEYVVRYTGPMVRAIRAHGGFVRIHCHGRLRNILNLIAGMEPDALDPIEPPPQGDVGLAEVRARYGRQLVLFGNLEIADLEGLSEEAFAAKVRCAMDEGMAGDGRGFVLLPSACPYGRIIPARTLRNYEVMLELAGA